MYVAIHPRKPCSSLYAFGDASPDLVPGGLRSSRLMEKVIGGRLGLCFHLVAVPRGTFGS